MTDTSASTLTNTSPVAPAPAPTPAKSTVSTIVVATAESAEVKAYMAFINSLAKNPKTTAALSFVVGFVVGNFLPVIKWLM